jgi:hypothetical protein
MLISFFRLAKPTRGRGIIKDPTVWLDGARPPPQYDFKNKVI